MTTRILVADDEPGTLDIVSQALERPGVQVVRAETGGELIERLADEGPFDLVVTDISMPWMSGLQAAQSARTAGLGIPIVVMTALQDGGIEEQVKSLGNRAVLLRKPFGLRELEAAVISVMPQLPLVSL